MKNQFGFMGKVDVAELELSPAFIDYLNDTYYEGAAEVLDDATLDFEFNNFFETYAK